MCQNNEKSYIFDILQNHRTPFVILEDTAFEHNLLPVHWHACHGENLRFENTRWFADIQLNIVNLLVPFYFHYKE